MDGEAQSRLFVQQDMLACDVMRVGLGEVAVWSSKGTADGLPNEDSALVVDLPGDRGILAVADGMGGLPAGEDASKLCLDRFRTVVRDSLARDESLRDAVLNGYEAANRTVIEGTHGGATTLAVVELDGRAVRSYHVGDSIVLVSGQRGKLKHQTLAHSPVGYAVESGMLSEEEAFDHADRHVISNVLGSDDMRIEIGPQIELADHDTVVLASDGLFDNLRLEEIIELARKGKATAATTRLARAAIERMAAPTKPDDLTVLLFRLARKKGVKARS